MMRVVLVRASIKRFAVFAVDPAVTVKIEIIGVGAIFQVVGISQAVVVRAGVE